MTYQLPDRYSLRNSRSLIKGLPFGVVLSSGVVALVLAWSLVPQLFTAFDPYFGNTAQKLLPPGTEHWFGTDHLGRDLFARVVYGACSSVTSIAIAVAIGLFIGSLFGLLGGFVGGWVDVVLARFIDVLLAIPNFLLAVVIVSSFGFHTINVAVATGLSSVAIFARLMRSETLKTYTSVFVEASGPLGGSR